MNVKIVQILFAPSNATWQEMLLGLGSDGVVYVNKDGEWKRYLKGIE
jgi:hypothetical protein